MHRTRNILKKRKENSIEQEETFYTRINKKTSFLPFPLDSLLSSRFTCYMLIMIKGSVMIKVTHITINKSEKKSCFFPINIYSLVIVSCYKAEQAKVAV